MNGAMRNLRIRARKRTKIAHAWARDGEPENCGRINLVPDMQALTSSFKMSAEGPTAVARSPLHQVKAGRQVRVCELCGSPEMSCRLRELGLHEGAVVRLIASHTNIICQICNTRL